MNIFTFESERLNMHHSRDARPRQDDFPMAVHNRHELYYFISGKGSYYVEGNNYRLCPGCVVIIRAGETHRLHIMPDCPYERIAIHFAESGLDGIDPKRLLLQAFTGRPLGTRNLYMPEELNRDLIRAGLEAISANGRNISDPYEHCLLILSHLCAVLNEIRRCYLSMDTDEYEQNGDTISRVAAYINSHLAEDFNLQTLANRFFISKSYLNTQFKKVTGSTIWEFTIIKRLIAAREYIQSGMTANKACAAVGWNDYSAFYRQYRSRFGVSPAADRKRK